MADSALIQELLRRLIAQQREHALVLLDPDGQIVAWFSASEYVFGYTSDEVIGQSFSVLFTPEDVAKRIPQYEKDVARQNGRAEDDRWMVRKDERRFWATGVLVPLRADDGTILGFAKILRNRTDLKGQMESAQNRADSLQAANEHKNHFITTLAHELRNPLSAIANSLSILQKAGSQTEDCKFARATIHRQLDHMRRMIEDLLEAAKTRVGKIQLNLSEMPLNEIVRDAVEACRGKLDARTHSFELIMADAPIIVRADRERLLQVFVNLIENAIKFTEYGGRIWVKLSVESDEAVFKIEDTGIGISPEMLPRIFDLFTQAEFGGESDSGLGIGLSVVRDLSQLHGGTVQVRSDGIGKGSEFTVRLPLAGADRNRPNRPTMTENLHGRGSGS